ncbi:hypothetical protein VDR17_13970, partial [Xanthomonas campestris pv. campestris]|nr:hypothetical protein [Xanthomonas campestris pv. campestris]
GRRVCMSGNCQKPAFSVAKTGSSGTPLQTSRPCGRWVIGGFSGATNYLGPIAGMLCDEAWDASSDIEQVLSQLAANLATPQEAQKFMTDARVALAKVR